MTRVMILGLPNRDSRGFWNVGQVHSVSDMTTSSLPDLSPRLPVTWWGLLIRAIVGIALMLVANFARIPLHSWAENRFAGDDTALVNASSVIFLLTPALIIAGVAVWMRVVERASIRVTGLLNPRGAGVGLLGGLAIVSVAMAAAWLVLAFVAPPLSDAPAETVAVGGTDLTQVGIGWVLLYLVVRALLQQGLPEELIFRGWFFHVTRTRPWLTLAWTTVAFTAIHLTSSGGQQSTLDFLIYLMIPLGMSILGGALMLWTGNVWWAAGAHGGVHIGLAVGSVVYPIALGPVAWTVIGLAQILLGVIILAWWNARRRR